MHRATRLLARDGVRQFLDIGTGIPTEPNLHQIAESVAPDARVVYADNDPIVLRFISEEDDGVYDLVRGYVAALAPGSFLVLSQLTPDVDAEKTAQAVEHFRRGGTGLYPRPLAGFTRFFDGLALLDPGVALVSDWRPDPAEPPVGPAPFYARVARKSQGNG